MHKIFRKARYFYAMIHKILHMYKIIEIDQNVVPPQRTLNHVEAAVGRMFFKIGVLENFAVLTGKNLCLASIPLEAVT